MNKIKIVKSAKGLMVSAEGVVALVVAAAFAVVLFTACGKYLF